MADAGRGRGPYQARGGNNGNNSQQAPRRPGEQPAWGNRAPAPSAPPAPIAPGPPARSRQDREKESMIVTKTPDMVSKVGGRGAPIKVRSNYFPVDKRPDMVLLQYRVDFTPDIDFIGLKKALLRHHEPFLGKYLFDGTLLYNVKRLPDKVELMSRRTSDNSDVKITLKLIKQVQPGDVEHMTVMNIILRRCLGMLNLVLMRRDYFDAEAAQVVPNHPLTIWPGYITTIREHDNGLLLGAEIAHKVLRRDTALNVMEKLRRDGASDLENSIKSELIGKIVMTAYNKKTYRIDDIDFQMNPMSTFHLRKEDRDVTYIEYYQTRYNQRITTPKQPLLISRPSRRDINRGDDQPIYLIPELCGMTGLDERQRNDFNLMRDVATITRVGPDKRVESLMRFRRRLAENPKIQEELSSWGLRFQNDIVTCDARILPGLTVVQGEGKSFIAKDGDWSRDIQRTKMAVTLALQDWVVIYPNHMANQVRNFLRVFKQVGEAKNFRVDDPTHVPLENDRTNNYAQAVDNACNGRNLTLIMCILRSARNDTYSSIKKLTYHKHGVPSQVITGRNVGADERKIMSIATKIMIQVATKVGAEPWRLQLPGSASKWLVAGYDTYHDARQKKAVGAFVSSINGTYSRFNSSVRIHENNEEISTSFKDHLLKALKAYYIHNKNSLPERIIVYRDGVGAGDILRVLETEVAGLKEACQMTAKITNHPNFKPAISFVIVAKRINTRFFAMNGRGTTNPPCGTVIDSVVTLPERFDFFLVSQKVTQGTVSPTNYNVVLNMNGFTDDNQPLERMNPDTHQALAYALTHMYFNWAGTLRVPAPTQYAHKLAYLVGESINDVPHESLSKLLYYL